jgi:hypothetical protein
LPGKPLPLPQPGEVTEINETKEEKKKKREKRKQKTHARPSDNQLT